MKERTGKRRQMKSNNTGVKKLSFLGKKQQKLLRNFYRKTLGFDSLNF